MKRTTILILVIAAALTLILFFMLIKAKDKQRRTNPWEFSVEEFRQVDDALVSHRETKRIRLTYENPKDIQYYDGGIYILFEKQLQVINIQGTEKKLIRWDDEIAHSMSVLSGGDVIIAYGNMLRKYSSDAVIVAESDTLDDESIITSITAGSDRFFAADGGLRQVLVYDLQLNIINRFRGESGVSSLHGFILPGNQFSLRINNEGELWITNPGIHQFQNYTADGRLRRSWGDASFGPEGFSGCCNPSYFAFLSDGSYVTSEKGMVRVKIHRESGKFSSYVAPPDAFGNGTSAPAIFVDDNDNIILLDFEQGVIRIFEPRKQ